MAKLSKAEVAKYLLKLRDSQESFLGFVRLQYPDWELADFQIELINTLDKLEKGLLGKNNLLITMPPRHAKSTFGTVLFPSYYMAKKPNRFTMSCSYNTQLSTDFGRQIRGVVEQKNMQQAFKDFHLSKDSRAADVWRTEDGGAYFAVGIGGTTSGRPANLLIVDDPIKSREEAESMTQRNKTWNYYTSALATRLQPENDGTPPRQIIILTRWHVDDLAGRLMQTEDWGEGRWEHVNFPAIKEITSGKMSRRMLPEDDPNYLTSKHYTSISPAKRTIETKSEEPLWGERFPLEELHRRKRLNPREFASLYQQMPYVEGGNLIKTEWWQKFPEGLTPENFTSLVIGIDTAFKKTETADYSAAVVAGMDRNGDMYIIEIVRGKYDFPELKQRLIRLNNKWRGKGLRGLYIEDKASGQSIIQELKRESGISVIPYKVVHDKVARVNAILPLIEGGRVYLPQTADWLDSFIDETVQFPSANHDDQVDAMTIALDTLSRTHVGSEAWELQGSMSSLNNVSRETLGKSLMDSASKLKSKWTGWGLPSN